MKDNSVQVLLVEDNALDAILFREMFSKEPSDSFNLIHLTRMREAEAYLGEGVVDILLLDMGLPDAHGLDTVRRARAAAPNVPMIVLTGLDDEVLAAQALKEGAQDYLIKGQIENRALPRALRHAVERYRMQSEADLAQLLQLQYKDQFLSHVSHELRSPLFAIYQFVTILLDKLAGDINPQQHHYLEIVLRNIKQLQAMINDILEVTRFQAGKIHIEPQCMSAPEAIEYAVHTLQAAANAKAISLSWHRDEKLPSVWADPKRVQQILLILLDNAIKFTPQNGTVEVSARVLGDADFVTLQVADSGCGISPEWTEKIFERLFQISEPGSAGRKGLGLGLHICKELVTRQGGTIQASSAPGQGALFSVTLPVFSLPNLIAPSLRKQDLQENSATLVIVQMSAPTGWLSEDVRAETCHSIRVLMQQCLYSDRDIILPKMFSSDELELFFILAMTGVAGAEAIVKRLAAQLNDPAHIEYADLTLAISHRQIDLSGSGAGQPATCSAEAVAAKIQQVMDLEYASRIVQREQ